MGLVTLLRRDRSVHWWRLTDAALGTFDRADAGTPLPLQSPRLAIQELERCMEQLGLQGVQIGALLRLSEAVLAFDLKQLSRSASDEPRIRTSSPRGSEYPPMLRVLRIGFPSEIAG